ncbi:hypothetical protein DFH07DRAFT_782183 [Mycena maculata]|uniref:Uncharacterized protein n=1 Tax=Mycena maculata TaxID=230809 RepID=A0AAD7HUK7_9AGAR|nr:hypothetical protein DFH07DRAFT_782183 [Mycena maculata]
MSSNPNNSMRRRTAGAENHNGPEFEHEPPKERESKRCKTVSADSEKRGSYLNPFGVAASLPLHTSPNISPARAQWTIPAGMQLPPDQWTYGYTPVRTVAEQELYELANKSDPQMKDFYVGPFYDDSVQLAQLTPSPDTSRAPSVSGRILRCNQFERLEGRGRAL